LDLTPLGNLPIGPVGSTIVHIPTIITGILLGPVAGLIMGTGMGIISLLHALTRSSLPLDPFFINPLVSVLPRMAIGVVAYYVYAGLNALIGKSKVGKTISVVVGGAAGSITNTVLVFTMFYIVYLDEIVALLEGVGKAILGYEPSFKGFFIFTATTNGIMEMIAAGILTPAICLAYFKYNKNRIKA
jgi:uncharacterized membrane protein